MNKNLHTIDNYFRAALDDYEEKPDKVTWEKLNSDLDKEEAVFFKKKYSSVRKIVAVLFVLIAALILFEFYDLRNSVHTGNSKIVKANNTQDDKPVQDVAKTDLLTSIQKTKNKFLRVQALESLPSANDELLKNRKVISSAFTVARQPKLDLGSIPFLNQITPSVNNVRSERHAVTSVQATSAALPPPGSTQGISTRLLHSGPKDLFGNSCISSFKVPPRSSKWLLMGLISGEISDYILEDDSHTSSQNENKNSIGDKEKHDLSFSAGVIIKRKFQENWDIETGLIFSSAAIKVSSEKVFAVQKPSGDVAFKLNVSSGYVYLIPGFAPTPSVGDSLTTTGAQHNLNYLSIPLSVHLNKQKKRFGFSAGGGFTFNKLLSASLKTEINNQISSEEFFSKLEGMRSMYLGVLINGAFNYQLNDKISLSLTPVYKQAITPINKNSVVKTYPYSYGIAGGLTLRL